MLKMAREAGMKHSGILSMSRKGIIVELRTGVRLAILLKVGDEVVVELTPDDGFGDHDPSMLFEDDLQNVPPEYRMIGAEAEFHNDRGEARTFRVTKIEDGRITLDGNHPLAGQTIWFHLNILAIRDATADELSGAVPTGQDASLPTDTPPTLN